MHLNGIPIGIARTGIPKKNIYKLMWTVLSVAAARYLRLPLNPCSFRPCVIAILHITPAGGAPSPFPYLLNLANRYSFE
jgi:hypothetical protein